jgi:hypothetical protein
MKKVQLLTVIFTVTIFITSCEKDNTNDFVEEENNQSINWETTNPDIIASINKEIESKVKNNKVQVETYRNFRLQVDNNTPRDVIDLIKKEIDQIYSASGLKRSTISKMDNVRSIHLAPTGQQGMYYSRNRIVINDYNTFRRVKRNASNVVFHELTHYYHDSHLPGGFGNREVSNNYNNASSGRIYPRGSYVLRNRVEYLGTSAEAYFSGTNRQPYNRATVRRKDSKLASFLDNNF